MNPLDLGKKKKFIYKIFKIFFEHLKHKFCLNLAEINFNILNFVLLSQYFHNNFKIKVKWQVISDFILTHN